jgi:hypothetical protein
MSGDGKCEDHKKVMIDKALLYSNAIHISTMWRGESAVAYNYLFMPSLAYGLPETTLTKEECEAIQRPVVNAILPKMGIARSAPRKVVFGTKQYGGLGLTHLAALQGNIILQHLLGHLRCGDTTGELMQMLLEYTQLECGCRGNPLLQDYKNYECLLLNKNWIAEVWVHLSTCKTTVEINGLWIPKENRKRDLTIMERLVASGRFSGKELQQINYCRIYLQVLFMSDIANVKETEVEEWARRGKRQSGRKSYWEWPVQQRPVSWKAWKDAIEYLAPDNQISPTLGEWNKSHHQVMEWYVDCISNMLYRHTEGVWLRYHTSNVSRMRLRSEGDGCDKPERVMHIVETSERTRYIEVTELNKIGEEVTSECDVPFHYESGIGNSGRQLPWHVQRLVGDIAALDVPDNWDSNEPRDLLVATDVSVVFGVGYHSCVITNMNEKMILSGGGPDDGDPLLLTSYRSELGGLASALAVLGMLQRSGCLNIRSVKCVSDNQSAVRACKRKPTESIFHRTASDYDLLATITNLQADWCNGINIQYAWVRGHADSLERETTREERASIISDKLCDIIREITTGRD